MEYPYFGLLFCCGGPLLGSLTPMFFSKQQNKLFEIWLFSYPFILFGTMLSMLLVIGLEEFAGFADPTGFVSMPLSVIIPTTMVTVVLRLYEKSKGIG